jgi:hypothetical protein
MLEALPLLITTLVLISTFVYTVSQAEISELRANWNERRCEPMSIMMAQMIPTDDSVNRSDFSSENFQFCLNGLIDSSLAIFLSPVLKIFEKQLDTTNTVQKATNSLRTSAASLTKPLNSAFQGMYNKLNGILHQTIRIFYKINTIFNRIFGISTASIFAGVSMVKGIQNSINYIIYVILLILGILVILTIFFFFILFPYIPIILTTIAIISTTVAGAAAAGMSGSFCVAPSTVVAMKNGVWKRVDEVQPGEVLEDGSIVEGILQTTGKDASCVNIHYITLSESHLVFDEQKELWVSAGDHSAVLPCSKISNPKTLYCLNTSSRTWRVKADKSSTSSLLLRDWEELPDKKNYELGWEALVYELLNRQAVHNTSGFSEPGRGLFGPETILLTQKKGIIPIGEVEIGDFVLDHNNFFTEVLGLYKDSSEFVPSSGPNPAVWSYYEGKRVWKHPYEKHLFDYNNQHHPNMKVQAGFHLVTESGTFMAKDLWVRDFTEVGHKRIHETYPFILHRLNLIE